MLLKLFWGRYTWLHLFPLFWEVLVVLSRIHHFMYSDSLKLVESFQTEEGFENATTVEGVSWSPRPSLPIGRLFLKQKGGGSDSFWSYQP